MRLPITIQFDRKHWLMHRRKAVVTDAEGEMLMFIDQKTWTMSEEIEIFSDVSRATLIFRVGRNWDRFGNKNYSFFGQESGNESAVLRIPNADASRWAQLWSANYEILADGETMAINQESSINRLLQTLFGPLPSVFGACPSFLVRRLDGTALLRMTRKRGLTERYIIEKVGRISDDALSSSLVSLILLVLLTREELPTL